jgi:hypothetical protein
MMVLMALVTTFMTSPLLRWIYPAGSGAEETWVERSTNANLAGRAVTEVALR